MLITWLKFFGGGLLIIIAGTRLTRSADALGNILGLGTGWAGMLLLPLATSLPELVTSLRSVFIGSPDLACGNLFGSCLFNLTMLAMVDFIQGKGSIFLRVQRGHTLAASFAILLISIAAAGILFSFPRLWGWIGLDTVLLAGGYLAAAIILTVYEKHNNLPLEKDNLSQKGKKIYEKGNQHTLSTPGRPLLQFMAAAAVILIAGVALTDASDIIAVETGLGRTFVGSIMLAVATSLPEVVTTTTAARLERFDLAIGNIFGANMFNMFIFALIDMCYLPGALLHVVNRGHLSTIAAVVILTVIAIFGFVKRSQRTIGRLSFNSVFIAVGYLLAVAVLFYTGGG